MFTEHLLLLSQQTEQLLPPAFRMTGTVNAFQTCFCGSELQLARNAGAFCGENSWHYGCGPRELTGKNKVGSVCLLNMEIIIIIS